MNTQTINNIIIEETIGGIVVYYFSYRK